MNQTLLRAAAARPSPRQQCRWAGTDVTGGLRLLVLAGGAEKLFLFLVIAVLSLSCSASSTLGNPPWLLVRYRACFEKPDSRGLIAHRLGVVIAERAVAAGARQYRFLVDGDTSGVLRITCKSCINKACPRVSSAARAELLAGEEPGESETRAAAMKSPYGTPIWWRGYIWYWRRSPVERAAVRCLLLAPVFFSGACFAWRSC